MNKRTTAGAVLCGALIGTNLYWKRREQSLREGLTTSLERQESAGFEREELRAAQEAAATLNTRPEDLPEKAEAIDSKVRKLNRKLDALRDQWVETWWSARTQQPIDSSAPHVHSLELPEGTLSDAEAFGERTATDERGVAVIVAQADSTLVVTVGDELSGEFSAADIAQEIADRAGGGAGGSEQYATGGGGSELAAESRDVVERLEEEIQ